MTIEEKLLEMERLAGEVLAELQTLPDSKDKRPARYSDVNSRLIAAQVAANLRWLIQRIGE